MEKVLFILHYPPPIHGAGIVGRYIRESSTINRAFACDYVNLSTSTTVADIGKGRLMKLKRFVQIMYKVLYSLCKFKPDLVYFSLSSHGSGFYKDACIVLLAKLFRPKLVYHLHNKGVVMCQDRWLDNLLYRLVFKNAEVILLSKHLYYDVKKYVSESKVYYCANGIPELYSSKGFEKNNGNNDKVQILFLSNLIVTKGVYVLLDACKGLFDQDVLFHCTFIGGKGDIEVPQFQDKVKQLGLENNVEYLGAKYENDKVEAYLNADIFVHPTLDDCFPLVILEAMQFKLPVIATSEGGIPDIINEGETGMLVEKNDFVALTIKLKSLIQNSEMRRRMGAMGKKRFETRFSLKVFENRFAGILKEILKN